MLFDPVRRTAQGQFAQGRQIIRAEKVFQREGGAVFFINLSLLHALDQVGRLDIDERQLVRVIENFVGNTLVYVHRRRGIHRVVQAFDMLDIDRGIDVYAAVDYLLHVQIPLAVFASRGVGVRQLVHEKQLRTAREGGIDVKFLQQNAAVGKLLQRETLQPLRHFQRFGTVVRLQITDDDVYPKRFQILRGLQHGVGLAHARRIAEENFQFALLHVRLTRPKKD